MSGAALSGLSVLSGGDDLSALSGFSVGGMRSGLADCPGGVRSGLADFGAAGPGSGLSGLLGGDAWSGFSVLVGFSAGDVGVGWSGVRSGVDFF